MNSNEIMHWNSIPDAENLLWGNVDAKLRTSLDINRTAVEDVSQHDDWSHDEDDDS